MRTKSYNEYITGLEEVQIMDNALRSEDIYCRVACQLYLITHSQHSFECRARCFDDNFSAWYTYSFPDWKIHYTYPYIFFFKKDKIYLVEVRRDRVGGPAKYFEIITKHIVE